MAFFLELGISTFDCYWEHGFIRGGNVLVNTQVTAVYGGICRLRVSFKGTVMHIVKALINDRLCVSKVS